MSTLTKALEIDPEVYSKHFDGILGGMVELMTGQNPDQTPKQALETACGNQARVLATYQERLNGLVPQGSYTTEAARAASTAVKDFANLYHVLAEIKDRDEPPNPILCAILMSVTFSQSQALKRLFNQIARP